MGVRKCFVGCRGWRSTLSSPCVLLLDTAEAVALISFVRLVESSLENRHLTNWAQTLRWTLFQKAVSTEVRADPGAGLPEFESQFCHLTAGDVWMCL